MGLPLEIVAGEVQDPDAAWVEKLMQRAAERKSAQGRHVDMERLQRVYEAYWRVVLHDKHPSTEAFARDLGHTVKTIENDLKRVKLPAPGLARRALEDYARLVASGSTDEYKPSGYSRKGKKVLVLGLIAEQKTTLHQLMLSYVRRESLRTPGEKDKGKLLFLALNLEHTDPRSRKVKLTPELQSYIEPFYFTALSNEAVSRKTRVPRNHVGIIFKEYRSRMGFPNRTPPPGVFSTLNGEVDTRQAGAIYFLLDNNRTRDEVIKALGVSYDAIDFAIKYRGCVEKEINRIFLRRLSRSI